MNRNEFFLENMVSAPLHKGHLAQSAAIDKKGVGGSEIKLKDF